VRGDCQIIGLNFEETYALVEQWLTVQLMLSLLVSLGLKTKQVDYSNAFMQANIDDEVYCDLPQEFLGPNEEQYMLKLKKSLY